MLSLISYPSKIALQSEQCHTKLVISHWQLPCLTLIKAAVDSRTTSEQQPFISTGEFILICNNLITVRYNNIALCVRYTSTAQSILLSFMSLRNFFFWSGKPSKAIGSHSREQQKTYLYETQRKTVDRKHGDSFGYIAYGQTVHHSCPLVNTQNVHREELVNLTLAYKTSQYIAVEAQFTKVL